MRRLDHEREKRVANLIFYNFKEQIYYKKLYKNKGDDLTDQCKYTISKIIEHCKELQIPVKLYIQAMSEILNPLDTIRLSYLTSDRAKERVKEWLEKRKGGMANSYNKVKKDIDPSEILYNEAVERLGEENGYYIVAKQLSTEYTKKLLAQNKLTQKHIEFMKKILPTKTLQQILGDDVLE